jgi:hypothetical protein
MDPNEEQEQNLNLLSRRLRIPAPENLRLTAQRLGLLQPAMWRYNGSVGGAANSFTTTDGERIPSGKSEAL